MFQFARHFRKRQELKETIRVAEKGASESHWYSGQGISQSYFHHVL